MTEPTPIHLPPGPGSLGGPEGDVDPTSEPGYSKLIESLRGAKAGLDRRTASDLARSLGETGARFLDPGDPIRTEALDRLPEETGHSPPMCTSILDGMARDWTSERLQRLLAAEFPDPAVLDGFRDGPEGTRVTATGGRLGFHIGSGNVPGVGATSMIRSLLVKCPVFLKPGSGDRILPGLFARALTEANPELGAAVAVVYWPAGAGGALEEGLLRRADRVVVYAGTDVVEGFRSRVPPTIPFVAYHHRISVGAVARECLSNPTTADGVAESAARAVAAYDRRGCVSPQVIWAERGGTVEPVAWAEMLANRLERLEDELPPSAPSAREASARQQLVGTAELRRAAGQPIRVFSGVGGSSMVIFGPGGDVPLVGPGRTVEVRPADSLDELSVELEPFARVLQTLALAAPEERLEPIARNLRESGLTRITSFAAQPWPPAWWHHDGRGPLRALVRWIELERV